MNGRAWTEEDDAALREMHCVEGLSWQETADRLGRTVKAVKLRCTQRGFYLPREARHAWQSAAQRRAREAR